MSDDKKEPIEIFACGADNCRGGGTHEWGIELVEIGDNTASIVCEKCGMPKMYYDMWTAP